MSRKVSGPSALIFAALLVLASFTCIATVASADGTVVPTTPQLEPQDVHDSVLQGLDWLSERQNVDGGWSSSVGITGLIMLAFASAGFDHTNRTVQEGLKFMRNFYHPDDGSLADTFQNYESSIALTALSSIGDPQDTERIEGIVGFLESIQFSETSVYNMTKDWYWGGFPNYAGIPDLSNSQFSHMGLQAASLYSDEIPFDEVVWTLATTFTQTAQNWPDVNELPWAHNTSLPSYGDGGFVYNGNRSRTPLGEKFFESYGSISAAGLFSYLAAGNDPRQPEVRAAREWLDHEYNFDANPNMVGKGIYYYLWTQSRVLAMSPQDWVVDGSGKLRDWRAETAEYFMDRQMANGGWPGNPQIGWREEEPELAAIYSLLSMESAYLMAPDPELEIKVSGGSSVRFITTMGEVLATNAVRGITVTGNTLTCTDPEVFRKVWVDIDGAEGTEATVTATGSWGEGRTSKTSETVVLGKGGANVHVGTGGFAGPFAIHLVAFDRAPVLEVEGSQTLVLSAGETKVVKIDLVESSGEGPITGAILVIPVKDNIVADVGSQGVFVPQGGTGEIELTISIDPGAKISTEWRMVVTSATAPPVVIDIKKATEDEVGSPDTIYWVLIAVLGIAVVVFFILPLLGRKKE